MASSVLVYISDILRTGKNLIFSDANDRLPPAVEKTLPGVIGRNQKNGVAATNSSGVPVDINGRPMAVAEVVEQRLSGAEGVASGAAQAAAAAVGAVAGRVLGVNGTVVGTLWLPAEPTVAQMQALQIPDRTLVFYPGT